MHYFSKSVTMSFGDALGAIKLALKRHRLEILAEIDLSNALRRYLAIDYRPYLILSTCSLQMAERSIEADNNVGSILLCNVVVQQHWDGRIEISTADPAATIGTINNADLIWTTRELRSLVEQSIGDIDTFAKSPHVLRHCEAGGGQLLHPSQ
jgi:uncharacterized protein (DUF302 family)